MALTYGIPSSILAAKNDDVDVIIFSSQYTFFGGTTQFCRFVNIFGVGSGAVNGFSNIVHLTMHKSTQQYPFRDPFPLANTGVTPARTDSEALHPCIYYCFPVSTLWPSCPSWFRVRHDWLAPCQAVTMVTSPNPDGRLQGREGTTNHCLW